MMPPADEYVRDMFAQQIIRMVNDDPSGHGWHVKSMETRNGSTIINLDSYQPLKSLDSNGIQSGCRKATVIITANFEEA